VLQALSIEPDRRFKREPCQKSNNCESKSLYQDVDCHFENRAFFILGAVKAPPSMREPPDIGFTRIPRFPRNDGRRRWFNVLLLEPGWLGVKG
jgi:hypothetical protein